MTDIQVLLDRLARPAQRAILSTGVNSLEELAQLKKGQVVSLHGIGKNAMKTIEAVLSENGLELTG